MAKTYVGIDIGACRLKLAVCTGGAIQKLAVADMPENLVSDGRIVSPETMVSFLKRSMREARISTRACAMILPASVVFTRTMTVPASTSEHLKLNLPYEFRDFITQEKDKYFYDYAVTDVVKDENEKPAELELIAAATLKETIADYSAMCHKAGLKLVTAIPEELGYMNLIRRFEDKNQSDEDREYCLINLGHTATRLYIFKGIRLQATRVVELGVQLLDAAIAEQYGIDEHVARARKHSNLNHELTNEACMDIYAMISIEIMRAINFYRFNSPDSNLTEVLLCGGGAYITPLVSRMENDLAMPVNSITALIPSAGKNTDVTLCPAAIGATMQ